MVILENIDKKYLRYIDIDIDIDKAILQNIDKISNRFKFGISNRAIISVIIIPYLQYTDWEHIDDGYLNQKMIGDVVGDFFFVCPCNYFAQQVGSSFLFCVHSKMNKSSLHFFHLVTQLELSFISILTFTQYAEHGNPVYYYYFNQVCLDIADLLAMCFLVLS